MMMRFAVQGFSVRCRMHGKRREPHTVNREPLF